MVSFAIDFYNFLLHEVLLKLINQLFLRFTITICSRFIYI